MSLVPEVNGVVRALSSVFVVVRVRGVTVLRSIGRTGTLRSRLGCLLLALLACLDDLALVI